MTTLQEKIEVMQAFARGEKIEWIHKNDKNDNSDEWDTTIAPRWNWEEIEFRIAKPEPKVGIPVGMLDSDGEIRYVLKDSPAHENLIHDGWKHILELDSEITLP